MGKRQAPFLPENAFGPGGPLQESPNSSAQEPLAYPSYRDYMRISENLAFAVNQTPANQTIGGDNVEGEAVGTGQNTSTALGYQPYSNGGDSQSNGQDGRNSAETSSTAVEFDKDDLDNRSSN